MKTYIPAKKAVDAYNHLQLIALAAGVSMRALAELNGYEDSYSFLKAKIDNPGLEIKTEFSLES